MSIPLCRRNSSRSDSLGHGGVKSTTSSPIGTTVEPWMSCASEDTIASTISITEL